MKQGFSLLELSIVLVIVAIMVAGGLSLTTAKVGQDQLENTYDEMLNIQKSMQAYATEFGKLPCPASVTLARTDALYGRQATDCADATPPAGVTRVEYPASSGKYVRIGGVPFYTLQMPERYLEDAFQNRYYYAVSEPFITAASSTSTGNIRVVDSAGASISDEAAFVIFSAGKSHKGAYVAKTGSLFAACDTAAKDGENCDADGIFIDAPYNDGTVAAQFYDDIILWQTRLQLFQNVGASSGGGESGGGNPVPTDVKFTTATHNGNFGGYQALLTWIRANGCAGYNVCSGTDMVNYFKHNANSMTVADVTARGLAEDAWQLEADTCKNTSTNLPFSSNSSSQYDYTIWTNKAYYGGTYPYYTQMTASSTVGNCSNSYKVACCKFSSSGGGSSTSSSSSSTSTSTSSTSSSSSSSSSSTGGGNYPLEIKGLTTTTFTGSGGLWAMNGACHAKYPYSWMAKVSNKDYIKPSVTAAGWWYPDVTFAYFQGSALQTSMTIYKCTDYTSNSNLQYGFVLSSTNTDLTTAIASCNSTFPVVCVGIR